MPARAAGSSKRAPVGPSRGGGNLRQILGFMARFTVIWAAILIAVSKFPLVSEWAVAGTIENIRLVLGLFGVTPEVDGETMRVGAVTLRIVQDCSPVAPTAGLWAAMLAFPTAAAWKAAGLAAGLAILWVYNVVRILILIPVLTADARLFPFIHAYVWQTLTLAAVCAVFITWYRWQPAEGRRS